MGALDDFKAAQRAGWSHFGPLQTLTTIPAAGLVAFAGITRGQRVLDVACGTGPVAVTAARMGAAVTGLDLTPALLDIAHDNGQRAGVTVEWREGDAEALPFDAWTFDVVVSQFGHMFAPRPDVAIGEMLRVLKRGGTIAFSTWPVEGYVAKMFALVGRYMPPPPPGVSPPVQWGDERIVRERLGSAVREIEFARALMPVPALSLTHQRDTMEQTVGPMLKLVSMLKASDPEKLAAYRRELDALTAEYYADNTVRQDYLMTRATKV